MFDFCYNLTRDYMIIKYISKNLEVTRIFDIQIRILKYGYDYVVKIIVKVLI